MSRTSNIKINNPRYGNPINARSIYILWQIIGILDNYFVRFMVKSS